MYPCISFTNYAVIIMYNVVKGNSSLLLYNILYMISLLKNMFYLYNMFSKLKSHDFCNSIGFLQGIRPTILEEMARFY